MGKHDDEFPDDDLSDVSIDSHRSAYDDLQEWELDRILAERSFRQKVKGEGGVERDEWVMWYLIKWHGWKEHYWSWECVENLGTGKEDTLFNWQHRSMQEKRGLATPFDVVKWELNCERMQRRKFVKRVRLGLAQYAHGSQTSESGDDNEDSPVSTSRQSQYTRPPPIDESDDDVPLALKPRRDMLEQRSDSDEDIPLHAAKRRRLSTRAIEVGRETDRVKPDVARPLSMPMRPSRPSPEKVQTETVDTSHSVVKSLSPKSNDRQVPPPQQDSFNPALSHEAAPSAPGNVISKEAGSMSKPAGPSIFSNWAKQPTKKKISWLNTSEVHKGRQFKNLQQQNMSRKASAVERVPPRLAQPHLAEPLHAQSPTDASPTVSSMRPTAVRPNDPREERPEGGELLTCWFWAQGRRCNQGNNCVFEHSRAGREAHEFNALTKSQATCYFWFHSRCRSTPEKCKFSHNKTWYLAPDPRVRGSSFTRLHPSLEEQKQERQQVPDPLAKVQPAHDDLVEIPAEELAQFPGQMHPGELLGCYFFNMNGRCAKPDNRCAFPHVLTRWVAAWGRGKEAWNDTGKAYWRPRWKSSVDSVPSVPTAPLLPEPTRNEPPQSISSPTDSTLEKENSAMPPSVHFNEPAKVLPDLNRTEPSAPTSLMRSDPVMFTMSFSQLGDSQSPRTVNAMFETVEREESTLLKSQASGNLHFTHICSSANARLFRVFEGHPSLGDGDLLSSSADSDVEGLQNIASTLTAHSAAGVCSTANFAAVVYPAKSDWAQLFQPRVHSNAAAPLRIRFLPPVTLPEPVHNKIAKTEENKSKFPAAPKSYEIRRYEDLAVDPLFDVSGSKAAQKFAFIIFHADFQRSIDALTRRLLSKGVKVYHSTATGSWDYFVQQYCYYAAGGLILVHNSFPPNGFIALPNLGSILGNPRINFFRFSDALPSMNVISSSISPVEQVEKRQPAPEFIRLFPGGQALYLMDDCIENHPHDTFEVLRKLVNRAKCAKTPTYVVGRPRLLEWAQQLMRKAEGNVETLEPGEEDQGPSNLYKMLCELHGYDGPASLLQMFSRDDEDARSHTQQWDKDSTRVAKDSAGWYAGWALERVEEVRRFYLLSMLTSSLRQKWSRQYAHLAVMTPNDWCAEERRKEDKKRRIESDK